MRTLAAAIRMECRSMRGWFWVAAVVAAATVSSAATAQSRKQIAGVASFYDKNYSGRTAAGVRYDSAKFTAAHRTLPFGTKLVVTDTKTKRSVTVVVND